MTGKDYINRKIKKKKPRRQSSKIKKSIYIFCVFQDPQSERHTEEMMCKKKGKENVNIYKEIGSPTGKKITLKT